MPSPSLTYTLTNGNTADATQVMQNYNDILNGITDGTKDLSISALTCAGTATLNGNINLGNSSADDLSITASLASTLPIKTNNSYDIGSSTLGLRKLYLGNGGAGATCDIISASHATTREYQVPDCGAAADFVMTQVAQTIAGAKTFSGSILVSGTRSFVLASGSTGHGSTNTKIRRFTTSSTTGTDITQATSSTAGDSFTINVAGVYSITYCDNSNGAGNWVGISLNSANLTTSVLSLGVTEQLCSTATPAAGFGVLASCTVALAVNDVIRAHTDGFTFGGTTNVCYFRIVRVL